MRIGTPFPSQIQAGLPSWLATASGISDPSQVAGLAAAYRADAGTSSVVDAAALSGWNDQSGNARHLVQATALNQPTYRSPGTVKASMPSVRFDGTNDFMDSTGWSLAQPTTIFAVYNTTAIPAVSRNMIDGITARQAFFFTNTGALSYFAGSSQSAVTTDDSASHQICAVFNGASSGLFLDGTSISAANPGANGLNGLRVGSDGPTGTTSPFAGDIGEVLIYSGALSTADRQLVEGYLRSRWGTP